MKNTETAKMMEKAKIAGDVAEGGDGGERRSYTKKTQKRLPEPIKNSN